MVLPLLAFVTKKKYKQTNSLLPVKQPVYACMIKTTIDNVDGASIGGGDRIVCCIDHLHFCTAHAWKCMTLLSGNNANWSTLITGATFCVEF